MNSAKTADRGSERTEFGSVAHIGPEGVHEASDHARASTRHQGSRLLTFVEELRRRKVCRALTMYAVALWLISQIVDLAYVELGLPEWTLRFVIVVGLAGLPIALLASWLLDLTPDGLVLDGHGVKSSGQRERSGADRILDGVLLAAAIAIAANLVYANVGNSPPAESPRYERIAIEPFHVGTGDDAAPLSESLAAELRHELANRTGFRVVAPRDPFSAKNCLTLTGSISTDEGYIRITAALIDNRSTEVVWSEVIEKNRADALMTVADIARDIVAVLQLPGDNIAMKEHRHGG